MVNGEKRVHLRFLPRSLVYFKSLLELYGALRDAVAGHKFLSQQGMVHGDFSLGNILITGLDPPNCGMLVDFDYCMERQKERSSLWDYRLTGTLDFMSPELLRKDRYLLPYRNPDIKTIPHTPPPPAGSNVPTENGDIPRWPRVVYSDDEDFVEPSPPAVVLRAATKIQHADHHDLEALFWTLCHLCIVTDGPGMRRDTRFNNARWNQAVYLHVERDFRHDERPLVVAIMKTWLMEEPEDFRERIIESFSPYFEPCKKDVKWLYDILRGAYSIRKFEGLHNAFIHGFERSMNRRRVREWHSLNDKYRNMEEEDEKRRKKGKRAKFDCPPSTNTTGASRSTGRKRGRDNSPEPETDGSSTSKSHSPQTKRQKYISLDAELPRVSAVRQPIKNQMVSVPFSQIERQAPNLRRRTLERRT